MDRTARLKKPYRSGRKLSRRDVAYVRTTNLSPSAVAIRLGITPDHVRKIRRGERGGSVPAYVMPSERDHAKYSSTKSLLQLGRQLLAEAECEVLAAKLRLSKQQGRGSTAPHIENGLPRNELLESRPWVIKYRVSQIGAKN
jgi:hypothetical protein